MEREIFDNALKSYLLFSLVLLGAGFLSAAVFIVSKSFKQAYVKRFKSILIMFLFAVAFEIGSGFFYRATTVHDVIYNVSKMLFIATFSWLGIKAAYMFVERIYRIEHIKSNINLTEQMVGLLKKTAFGFIGVIGLSMILNVLGLNVMSIVTGLGIGGLAVALAAQEILSNIFGGITLFTSGIIKVGDFIEAGGNTGFVEEIGMRTVKVRKLNGHLVIMPNSQLVKSTIINHSSDGYVIVNYVIGVTYSTSLEKLKKAVDILKGLLESDSRIELKDKISVGFYKFDAYSLNLYVSFYLRNDENAGNVKQDFHFQVKRIFDDEGIEIAFPTQSVELKNINRS